MNPICLEAGGSCSLVDVRRIRGFEEFLEIMKDKSHPERESYITWYGLEFNPHQVDQDQVYQELSNLNYYILEIENPQD